MGRTLQTSTQLIREFEETLKPYARTLREEDCRVLLELFGMARLQSAAIASAARYNPYEVIFLAMLGGVFKRLIRLEQRQAEQTGNEMDAPECGD